MSVSSEQKPSLISRFLKAALNLLPGSTQNTPEPEDRRHSVMLDNRETRLFLVLENNIPNEKSHPWTKENVLTEMNVMPAEQTANGLVAENLVVDVRALYKYIENKDHQSFLDLKPGEWFECKGKFGGPIQETFFPHSIKVRNDLQQVMSTDLPKADDLDNVITLALFGANGPATRAFTP